MSTDGSISRRQLLILSGLAAAHAPQALAAPRGTVAEADLRGSFQAAQFAVTPKAEDMGSAKFRAILARAASENKPVFLPPGTYPISGLDLPDNTRLTGVAGASRLVYTGDGSMLRAEGLRRLELSNIIIDGANRWLSDQTGSLVDVRDVDEFILDNCEIIGSSKTALHLERCAARITGNRLSGAADYAIYAVDGRDTLIADNEIGTCGNGGILVHRFTKGADGTKLTGNRLTSIGARNGGTGPFGNAINLFRADDVMVADNFIRGAAFSAIRANAASNTMIANNQCLGSGETAIYAEFGFEGALVTGNLVDGAANGISVVNFDSGGRLATIANNIVRNISDKGPYVHDNVGFGFGISVEADAAVSGNVMENIARFGILAGWGPYLRNLAVTGNVVRRAATGMAVSVAPDAGAAVIANNLFAETPKGAIIGYRWHDAASGDLVDGSSDYPHLMLSGNRRS
ncbi:TIGR03808 family TAT-translocated repetitive protein [Rhizobium sp. SSA_523]|uniref:TIGR03808 family TAT-translocated repetitive protein n=1 Tax=Rhizobium sp. SSA_523 TaxID=2952477 RepID=UPI0020917464|nr:TIGR03808 family TAT-translocated repetitive protein [Rhizobium sp. SSA_523]MCO5730973.1 TIGR03808 family TAT-translocated repetitive protein [Rhizobium sp. SSA_523]WKC24219.1 TIGR03808 family TAT-translocated repetitive protein [Rhizobium sp. SSA_523]